MKAKMFIFMAVCCTMLGAAERTVSYNFDGDEKFTANTGVFVEGVKGKALSFNGKQYAQVEWPLINNTKHLVIELDMFVEKAALSTVLACFEEHGNNREFIIGVRDGMIVFSANGSGKANNTSSVKMPIPLKEWAHVRAEWKPGKLTINVNGKSKTVSGPKQLRNVPIPLQLGRYWAKRGMRYFNGKIDNLTITSSDQAISAAPQNNSGK